MGRSIVFTLAGLILFGTLGAQDLSVKDSSNFILEDISMGHLFLDGCSHVTIRNCKFSYDEANVLNIYRSDHIVVDSCEIDGQGDACSGIGISGNCSYITISNCDIHNIADDGVEMGSSDHVSFFGNRIHHLLGKGTDGVIQGPCYNGHSDGFEISYSSDVLLDGNLLYDIKSTSCLILGNWGGQVKNLTLRNNIFYSPATGFVLYIHYADSVKLYNNIFWESTYGGLALGADVTNLEAYNNIIQSINLNHAGISFDPENHHFDYNIIAQKNQGMPLQEHDIFITDPGFAGIPPIDSQQTFTEVTADMFRLLPYSPAIDAAFVDEFTPVTDYHDSSRVDYPDVDNVGVGLESYYDMGPLEYSGPTGLMVIKPVPYPAPGEYDTVIMVSLSTPTEDAIIYYTLDGSYPTGSSLLYESLFELRSNTFLQARAFKDGLYNSPVLMADYIFNTDLVAPYVKGVIVEDANTVRLIFNEPLDETSATDKGNYFIDGITVTGVSLETDLSTVLLTVSGMETDLEYYLQVSGIMDRAEPPLTMIADTIGFVYSLAIWDDFEDGGRLNWSPKTPSRWSLEMDGDRGTYHLNTTEYSQNGDMPGEYSLLDGFEFQDFTMEITVRQPEYFDPSNAFADYGVIFGFTDATNFYYFLANKDAGSNELFRVTNGVRYSILNIGESIIPDDDYHTFSFKVLDGYFYYETDDFDWEVEEDFPAGKVGLCSYNDEVYFDEFRITPSIEEPSGAAGYIKNDDRIRVYPNPANGRFTLVLPEDYSGGTVLLYDMTGRAIQIPVSTSTVTVSTGGLISGVYILQVPFKDGVCTKKLLVY